MKKYYFIVLTLLLSASTMLSHAGNGVADQVAKKGTRVCIVNLCNYGDTFTNVILAGDTVPPATQSFLETSAPKRSGLVSGQTRTSSSISTTPGEPFLDYIYALNDVKYEMNYKDKTSSLVQTETVGIMLDSLGYKTFVVAIDDILELYKEGLSESQMLETLAKKYQSPVVLVLRNNDINMKLDTHTSGKGRTKSVTGSINMTSANIWELYNYVGGIKKIDDVTVSDAVVMDWKDIVKSESDELPIPSDVMVFVNGKAAKSFANLFAGN